MSKTDHIQVQCPCCHAKLTLDPESGLVLKTEAKKSDYSFDEALQKERHRKAQADELFAKAFRDEQERTANLEKKFRKALDSKDDLPDPHRPFDLD